MFNPRPLCFDWNLWRDGGRDGEGDGGGTGGRDGGRDGGGGRGEGRGRDGEGWMSAMYGEDTGHEEELKRETRREGEGIGSPADMQVHPKEVTGAGPEEESPSRDVIGRR